MKIKIGFGLCMNLSWTESIISSAQPFIFQILWDLRNKNIGYCK